MNPATLGSVLSVVRALLVAGAVVAISVVRAAPGVRIERVSVEEAAQAEAAVAAPGGSVAVVGDRGGGVVSGPAAPKAGLECRAGRNGGATAPGVTATRIKLGATVVETGIGRTFLADVRHAMNAVVNEFNAGGGVCGRRLQLLLKDDGWDANRGFTFIQNLVEGDNVFALAVVPSSEGLRAASKWLQSKGVPVVGTDGMLVSQYTTPVIFPVASATITAMHIIAKNAYSRRARQFALVYDSNYRFGVEGAYAFNSAVRRLTGNDIPGYSNPLTGSARCSARFCGVKAGNPSYGPELQVFKSACRQDPECDFVLYLLEPDTADKWMKGGGIRAAELKAGVGAPQPLFNRRFGASCDDKCHGMWVWTGFVPPIEPFANEPAVAAYVNALRDTSAQADPNNSFVQGGYLGMKLLVEALERVGPHVTRPRLMAVLNSMSLSSGLSRPLRWSASNHFANQCMLGFSIQARPSFAGWRQETGWVCDPWPGQDIPPES